LAKRESEIQRLRADSFWVFGTPEGDALIRIKN
jgi:hypothetical protein